jgi:hypothetical protein
MSFGVISKDTHKRMEMTWYNTFEKSPGVSNEELYCLPNNFQPRVVMSVTKFHNSHLVCGGGKKVLAIFVRSYFQKLTKENDQEKFELDDNALCSFINFMKSSEIFITFLL